MSVQTIESLDDLRQHLKSAMQLEQSTIPLYLYAYYSLKNPLSGAAQTIRSIAMQEMLHLSLVGNLLNATGGQVDFQAPEVFPTYPFTMPHHEPDLILRLEPPSLRQVREVFLAVEHPRTKHDVPQSGNYTTIGQFYAAVRQGFARLVERDGERAVFQGDPAFQLAEGYHAGYANVSGNLFAVYDLKTALAAIHEITRQGEGTARSQNDGDGDLAHFWLFNQIADDTLPLGEVWPVTADPKTDHLLPGPLQSLSQLFNDSYGLLLRLMNKIYATPAGPARQPYIAALVPLMYRVLKPIALQLVSTPVPGTGANAGPSFERSETPQPRVLALCESLCPAFPALQGALQGLRYLPPIDEGK
jgi:ferritin-like protein